MDSEFHLQNQQDDYVSAVAADGAAADGTADQAATEGSADAAADEAVAG